MSLLTRACSWPLRHFIGRTLWVSLTLAALIGFGWFLYERLAVSRWSATLGMRVTSVSVRTAADSGNAITKRALIFGVVIGLSAVSDAGLACQFVSVVALFAFCIGCLAMLWDDPHRTWHDRLSGTDVINNRFARPTPAQLGARGRRAIFGLAGLGLVVYAAHLAATLAEAVQRMRFR